MICERCAAAQAVMHITVLSDAGVQEQHHFCANCAGALGISTAPPPAKPRDKPRPSD
jgi:protein-arginine kinase activator protein McsA